jgi:hypothetical protein
MRWMNDGLERITFSFTTISRRLAFAHCWSIANSNQYIEVIQHALYFTSLYSLKLLSTVHHK